MSDPIKKVVIAGDASKGATAPKITVVTEVPLREGAKAPSVSTPSNVPTTSGPTSVTNQNK